MLLLLFKIDLENKKKKHYSDYWNACRELS